MKNASDGCIVRLDMAKERILEPEDISIEFLKTKKQREQRLGGKSRQSKVCETTTKGVTHS